MAADVAALEQAVRAALRADGRISHPELIAVSADVIGTVVLRGAVDSPRERHVARVDAEQVRGVFEVINHLDIHPPVPDRRADDAIRTAALERLSSDSAIRADHVHVRVAHGRVTLTGYVHDERQRARAARALADLDGVTDVVDEVELR